VTNDLEQIAAVLLKHRLKQPEEEWGIKKGCRREDANIFLICCLLDWQQKARVAWEKGENLVKQLGEESRDPDAKNLWATISNFPKDAWDSKYEHYRKPHRFRKGYTRLWGIANDICARYEGDARNIWLGRSPFDALVHLWALGAGDQISRLIVGALRDCGEIEGGSGDVKADVHLRRVLGRAVYGEEISGANAAKVIELTRQLNPIDPWLLDWPLWNIGKDYCKPTDPKCSECYLHPHCEYYRKSPRA